MKKTTQPMKSLSKNILHLVRGGELPPRDPDLSDIGTKLQIKIQEANQRSS